MMPDDVVIDLIDIDEDFIDDPTPIFEVYADSDGDAPIFYLAPPPTTSSTVPANDLLTFVGSGAHDFIAYRLSNNESYCIYPVRVDSNGRVTGQDCTTIKISTQSYNRDVTYGTDDISLQLTGNSYHYSDMTGKYLTLWNASAYRSPIDILQSYLLIALIVMSLIGGLARRFRG